jgi:hypothetical protein
MEVGRSPRVPRLETLSWKVLENIELEDRGVRMGWDIFGVRLYVGGKNLAKFWNILWDSFEVRVKEQPRGGAQ